MKRSKLKDFEKYKKKITNFIRGSYNRHICKQNTQVLNFDTNLTWPTGSEMFKIKECKYLRYLFTDF